MVRCGELGLHRNYQLLNFTWITTLFSDSSGNLINSMQPNSLSTWHGLGRIFMQTQFARKSIVCHWQQHVRDLNLLWEGRSASVVGVSCSGSFKGIDPTATSDSGVFLAQHPCRTCLTAAWDSLALFMTQHGDPPKAWKPSQPHYLARRIYVGGRWRQPLLTAHRRSCRLRDCVRVGWTNMAIEIQHFQ